MNLRAIQKRILDREKSLRGQMCDGSLLSMNTQQRKLAQHHRRGDVGASPFGSWDTPSLKRALHSLHVFRCSGGRDHSATQESSHELCYIF